MTPPDPTRTDRSSTGLIDRREYLRITGGLAAGAAATLAGCTADDLPGGTGDGPGGSDDASATGLLATSVSDQPGDIGDFESCTVTIDGVWIGPRAGDDDDDADTEDETDDEEDTDGEDEEATEDETDDEQATEDDAEDQEETAQKSTAGDAAVSQPDDEDAEDGPPQDADTQDGDDEGDDGDGDDQDGETEDADEGDGEEEEEEDGDEDGGRTYLEFEEPQEADLVQLQGDASQLVGEHELEVGTYQYLQLDVSGVEGVLEDGGAAEVETPGNAPLQFQESFDVREGYRTTFLADFTPVRRGNGSYIFQPVASETEVSYEEIQDDDGGADGSEDGTDDGSDDGTNDGDDGSEDDGDDTNDTDDGTSDAEDGTQDAGDDTTADGGSAGGNEST